MSDENKNSKEKADTVEEEAGKLMKEKNVKRIWRCPKRKYWFVNKELAEEYSKSKDIVLDVFNRTEEPEEKEKEEEE